VSLTKLMSADDVAEILGLSRAQVYLVKHAIGFIQLGRVVRFDPERVRAYVDEHRRGEPEKIRAINVRRL
jgi:predicted DNA-binding transcriptional regulator AlpA